MSVSLIKSNNESFKPKVISIVNCLLTSESQPSNIIPKDPF